MMIFKNILTVQLELNLKLDFIAIIYNYSKNYKKMMKFQIVIENSESDPTSLSLKGSLPSAKTN